MSKCANLARLAKSPIYTHVHFYRQNPGSPSDLYQHRISRFDILDPSHPAAKTPYRFFPNVQTDHFRLRTFPNALLVPNSDSTGAPTWPKINSWADRVTRASDLRKELRLEHAAGMPQLRSMVLDEFSEWVAPPVLVPHPAHSIPMTLYFSIGKARTHKHAVKRRRLRTKFKAAVNLIVTRGAQVKPVAQDVKELVFDDEAVRKRGHKWILPDWAYICYPAPSLYLASYPELIQAVSTALENIWASGMRLEKSWAEAEMRERSGLPPLSNLDSRLQRKTRPRRTDDQKVHRQGLKARQTNER